MLHFVDSSSYQKTSRNLKTSHTIAKKKATCIISQPPSKKAKRNKCLYISPIANLPHTLLPFPFRVNVRTNIVMSNTNDNQNSSNKSVGSTYNAPLATAVVFAINAPSAAPSRSSSKLYNSLTTLPNPGIRWLLSLRNKIFSIFSAPRLARRSLTTNLRGKNSCLPGSSLCRFLRTPALPNPHAASGQARQPFLMHRAHQRPALSSTREGRTRSC